MPNDRITPEHPGQQADGARETAGVCPDAVWAATSVSTTVNPWSHRITTAGYRVSRV